MITARGACLAAGGVLAWLVGRLLGVPELSVVAVAAGVLVAAGVVLARVSSATVAVRREASVDRLPADGHAEVTVELRNDARLPASLLLVSDQCPYGLRAGPATAAEPPRFVVAGVASGSTAAMRYEVRGAVRGRYRVGPVEIRVRDPFGVSERVRRYRGTDEIVVYPRIEPLPEAVARGTHRGSGASDARRLFNTGDEFYGLREYTSGDDLRQVHWPSTAHRQRLMVRQHELPWQSEATVVCDTRRDAHRGTGADTTLERAISLTASILAHLAERDYRLRLVTADDRGAVPVEPRSVLLDRLAVLEASRAPSIGPALARLRAAGLEGLLVAVIASPPGRDPVGSTPDTRALLDTGRHVSGRLAIVVDTGGPGSPESARAQVLAQVLRAQRWRAVVLAPRQPLAEAWRELALQRHRRTLVGAPR